MGEYVTGRIRLAENDPSLVITEALDKDGNCEVVADVLVVEGVATEGDLSNAARIVACWNAMTGIHDPAATMKEVREVVSSLTKIIEDMRIDEDFDASTNNAGGICFGDVSSDALVAARALLSKLGGE